MLSLVADLDEFKGTWRALGRLESKSFPARDGQEVAGHAGVMEVSVSETAIGCARDAHPLPCARMNNAKERRH